MEFISISRILKSAPAKYTRAYLYTETDESDITYFIIHQLEVIHRAISDLLIYLEKKSNEIKSVEQLLRKSPEIQNLLNYRQIALINRALKTPDSIFYIESPYESNKCGSKIVSAKVESILFIMSWKSIFFIFKK